MKTIFLRPVDVWMFRDGRPFDAGSGHRAESLFPPYPSVIQGAIRTFRMIHENIPQEKVAEILGTAHDYKKLEVRGPFIAKLENGKAIRYYPQPADAIIEDDSMLKPALLTDLKTIQDKVRVSSSMPYLIGYENMLEKAKKGTSAGKKQEHKQKELLWISETEFEKYKLGSSATATPESKLFVREDRFGIGINNDSRVVKEGMLYEAQFIRPCKDVGLLIEVGGKGYENFPENGVMQLGGESRSAWFEKVEADPLPSPKKGKNGYKVYFATPAYFENGWRTDWNKAFGKADALKAAAIGRYESIGGFDRASKDNHKPAFRYVPAGSVYYFECENEINISQLTDLDSLKQIGFGQVILKEW
jgi:CRISPR-associated protein Cmr3